MFLKNKNIIFKIRRSKVTDYAALNIVRNDLFTNSQTNIKFLLTLYFMVMRLSEMTKTQEYLKQSINT